MKRGSDEISDAEEDGTQVKRGRGRPKIPDDQKTKPRVPSGKPRGRPRKYPEGVTKVSSGRGRGRPKKDPLVPSTPKAKKAVTESKKPVTPVRETSSSRGRPRKSVTQFTQEVSKSSPKAGRGRPKKTPNKGRGRPRKSEHETPAKKTPAKSPSGRKRGRPSGSIKLVLKVNSPENGGGDEGEEEDVAGEESS